MAHFILKNQNCWCVSWPEICCCGNCSQVFYWTRYFIEPVTSSCRFFWPKVQRPLFSYKCQMLKFKEDGISTCLKFSQVEWMINRLIIAAAIWNNSNNTYQWELNCITLSSRLGSTVEAGGAGMRSVWLNSALTRSGALCFWWNKPHSVFTSASLAITHTPCL